MDDNIRELLQYLSSDRIDIRNEALRILAHSINSDFAAKISTEENISIILNLLKDSRSSADAASVMANIIVENPSCPLQINVMETIIEHFNVSKWNRTSPEIDIYLSLLNNITISEEMSNHFMTLKLKNKDCLQHLLDVFFSYQPQLSDGVIEDSWQHVSSILCNATRVEKGRKIVLNTSLNNLEKILKEVDSLNPIRRRGAVACIRTCLFDESIHWWFLNELKALPVLLYPILTPLPFSEEEKVGMHHSLLNNESKVKGYEPEIDIRQMLIECMLLLCQKRQIRKQLRRMKVYPIVRNLDYEQNDERTSELILELVNFLMRDEEGEEKDYFSGSPVTTSTTTLDNDSNEDIAINESKSNKDNVEVVEKDVIDVNEIAKLEEDLSEVMDTVD